MEKVRYVKAHYQPLEDTTPLPRNVVNQPIEPVPDHKLVVELAGQWGSNRAYFQLAKTDVQAQKVARAVADMKTGHRTLATFKGLENEAKNLYLVVPLQGLPNPLTFLLAENLMPVENETEMDEWETVMIPVRALAYLDESKDKEKAAELKGGYLYVFWKGRLWRELQITEAGYYKDIDTEYYRVRDQYERQKSQPVIEHREASGFDLPQFWVPYKVAGEVQAGESGIQLMFSPDQKTYTQIEALESDTAKLSAAATPLDELSIYSQGKAFEPQEHTSDIQSAKLHQVTEDDMSWLTEQCVLKDKYAESNTPVVYVDGKNDGFLVKVEVGLASSVFGKIPPIYAVLKDENSEWKQSILMEANGDGEDSRWRQALFTGLPTDGRFTLFIANPKDPHGAEFIFTDIPFEELANDQDECEEIEHAEMVEESFEEAKKIEELRNLWLNATNF
ncbi:hypothetical protein [Photobacterium sp. 1_MG-2023]|uniref:hypothetical protein n=1 Tax=Photobacterium sp. 1_MG-2023 TaxID=3062646 RepID=UPI0026E13123|nr:hypothetical protein [Photobacterium sp. 1_MG-2023]MDO6706063.1 hypothetical protein [Photobacterium sp. 1_MG-2023]